jgi:hypothetical protein
MTFYKISSKALFYDRSSCGGAICFVSHDEIFQTMPWCPSHAPSTIGKFLMIMIVPMWCVVFRPMVQENNFVKEII